MQTFGLTPAETAGYVAGFLLSTTKAPTSDHIETIISEVCARVCAILRAKGIDPDALTVADEAYLIARAIARRAVIAEVEALRNRGTTTLTSEFWDAASGEMDAIFTEPAKLGSGRSLSGDAPNFPAPTTQRDRQINEARQRRSLLARMAADEVL